MKQNVLTWAVSAMLLGGALASCSSDAVVNDEPQVVDKDTRLFIKVSIADPGQSDTRANSDNSDPGNYEQGSTEEMAINSVLFVFYDALGNYINSQELARDKFTTGTEGGENVNGANGNNNGSLETTLQVIVPVELKEGQGVPEYVMAYVNPTKKAASDTKQAFGRALTLTRELNDVVPFGEGDAAHKGYTMSNSVYYTGTNADLPVISTKLPENGLYESEAAATTGTVSTTIYVERVVAKVVVTQNQNISQEDNTVGTGDDQYTLTFTPLAWGVNNIEKNSFLVKNFRSEQTNGAAVTSVTNLTYGVANGTDYMGGLTNPSWNYYTPGTSDNINGGHRTFWAYSPTYFSGGKYPESADQYGDGNGFSLTYRSYNDIYDVTGETAKIGTYGSEINKDKCLYTLEHTMRPGVIADHAGRAVSSVTIVGKYSLKKGSTTYADGTNFYLSRGTDENTSMKIWVASDMKKAYLQKNAVVFLKETKTVDGKEETTWKPVPTSDKINVLGENNEVKEIDNPYLQDFVVMHPNSDIYGQVPMASRFVTLQIAPKKKADNSGYEREYYFRNANGVETLLTEDYIDTVNRNLYNEMSQLFGAIESFHSGMAYFNVPIRHLWGSDSSDLGTAKLGEFGVVRNHIYRINITGISGIGTAINDPADPIIPNVTSKKYFVKTQLRVLRWRLVPTQNAVLKPQ